MSLYPVLDGNVGRRFFDSLDERGWNALTPSPEDLDVEWIGSAIEATDVEEKFDVRPLYSLARRAMEAIGRGEFAGGSGPRDRFEAAYALDFHRAVSGVPGQILTDRRFWRFVSLGPFFAVNVWRQREKNLPTALLLPPRSGRARGGNAGNLSRNLPWRLYMRAEIGETEELVSIPGADLWWSHIFRVGIGRSHPTAHAFLREVGDAPVAIQRALAPRVTADRGRKTYDALDHAEITALVSAQRAALHVNGSDEEEPADPALEEES